MHHSSSTFQRERGHHEGARTTGIWKYSSDQVTHSLHLEYQEDEKELKVITSALPIKWLLHTHLFSPSVPTCSQDSRSSINYRTHLKEARDQKGRQDKIYWVGPTVRLVFSVCWLQQCLAVFNFIQNNFVRLYCDSCHISVHFKILVKIGEFLCSHFNIEDGRRYTMIFGLLCFVVSRKVKMQLKCKKRFVQCMEKVK